MPHNMALGDRSHALSFQIEHKNMELGLNPMMGEWSVTIKRAAGSLFELQQERKIALAKGNDPGFTPSFLVTVLVTVANISPSPLIAQPKGLSLCIHKVVSLSCHSYSPLVSAVLGGSSDPRVGDSSPSGRTNKSICYTFLAGRKRLA